MGVDMGQQGGRGEYERKSSDGLDDMGIGHGMGFDPEGLAQVSFEDILRELGGIKVCVWMDGR